MNEYLLNNRPTNNICCSKQIKNLLTFMSIFTNVYTWCEVLQTSNYIKPGDHIKNTVTTYGYDLIFIWLVTFLLIKLQNIITLNNPNYFTYFITCNFEVHFIVANKSIDLILFVNAILNELY